jgi:hypothetical protein
LHRRWLLRTAQKATRLHRDSPSASIPHQTAGTDLARLLQVGRFYNWM